MTSAHTASLAHTNVPDWVHDNYVARKWDGEAWPEKRWSIGCPDTGTAVAVSPRYSDPEDLTVAQGLAAAPQLFRSLYRCRNALIEAGAPADLIEEAEAALKDAVGFHVPMPVASQPKYEATTRIDPKHTAIPVEIGLRSDGTAWISVGSLKAGPHFQCDFYGDFNEGLCSADDFASEPPAWVIEMLGLDDSSTPAP